jgi:hypothetical protein
MEMNMEHHGIEVADYSENGLRLGIRPRFATAGTAASRPRARSRRPRRRSRSTRRTA